MKNIPLLLVILAVLSTFCAAQDGQQRFDSLGDFKLESGETIRNCRIGYRTFGRLNPDRSNIVVVATWFTGRTGEMMGLFGEGKLIDTSKYYVIAIDSLGNGISSSPSNSKLQPR